MEKINAKAQTQSLITRLAAKYGVDPSKLLRCLTTQVFKQTDGATPSNEELMVLLLVCENYGLNPFSREVFAFRGKGGDIVPVVSYDGWCKIVRTQKDFDGVSFRFSDSVVRVAGCVGDLPEYVECSMQLKGIGTPVTIQEYMVECFNDRSPVWKRWPRRMLRTRAFIQCARMAFSLTGLYDEGEAYSDEGFSGGLTLDGLQSSSGPTLKDTQPIQQSPLQPKPISVDRRKLDSMVAKLVAHATNRERGWERAFQWVDTNLAGEDKAYAESALLLRQKVAASALPLADPLLAEQFDESASVKSAESSTASTEGESGIGSNAAEISV